MGVVSYVPPRGAQEVVKNESRQRTANCTSEQRRISSESGSGRRMERRHMKGAVQVGRWWSEVWAGTAEFFALDCPVAQCSGGRILRHTKRSAKTCCDRTET